MRRALRRCATTQANLSQQMMRARVLAQAATVTVVGVGELRRKHHCADHRAAGLACAGLKAARESAESARA